VKWNLDPPGKSFRVFGKKLLSYFSSLESYILFFVAHRKVCVKKAAAQEERKHCFEKDSLQEVTLVVFSSGLHNRHP